LAVEKKISDIDYCYASWKLLNDLEKISYARNERIRTFQEKVNARRSMIVGIIALILPISLWIFLLFIPSSIEERLPGLGESIENTGTRIVGLLLLSAFLFLIVYMILKEVWHSKFFQPLKNVTEKDLKNELFTDIQIIDEKAENIVYSRLFAEPRIPEKFLSADLLLILIRYFESGQATFMKEAVFSLNLELQNTGHYTNMISNETLLQREKAYLSDKENNLKKKIELSDEQ
jgi:hypothetical protein